MERLTGTNKKGGIISLIENNHPTVERIKLLHALAHYEVLAEQGKLFEVIRCGECKNFVTVSCPMIGTCDSCDSECDFSYDSTGFCPYGERGASPNA
jgi:hypothetical protein